MNERTDGTGRILGMVRTDRSRLRAQRWQRTPGRWVDSPWDLQWITPWGEIDPHFEAITVDEAPELMAGNEFDELTEERLQIMRSRWEQRPRTHP